MRDLGASVTMSLGMGHRDLEIAPRGEAVLGSSPIAPAHRRAWWRRLAMPVAVVALYPLALTTSLSHSSGSAGVGPGALWSVAFHNVVNRPTLLLAATAVALWIAAAALWASSFALGTVVTLAVAAILSTACIVVSTGERRTSSSGLAALISKIRLGQSEASVLATLGPAPYVGTATRFQSTTSLPCLVYGTPANGASVLCFRDGRVAIK